jgi:DNA-directed RNA polymerase subunit RPC12/RpoP
MAVMINCVACKKYQSPLLNKLDNEVYCSECGAKIASNHFLKQQLKATGQFKTPQKSAFSVKCMKCKQEALPKLNGNDLVCSCCGGPAKNISKPFEILIRNAIKKGNEEL